MKISGQKFSLRYLFSFFIPKNEGKSLSWGNPTCSGLLTETFSTHQIIISHHSIRERHDRGANPGYEFPSIVLRRDWVLHKVWSHGKIHRNKCGNVFSAMPDAREKVQIFQFLASEKHVFSARPANVEKVFENNRKFVRSLQYVLNKKTLQMLQIKSSMTNITNDYSLI